MSSSTRFSRKLSCSFPGSECGDGCSESSWLTHGVFRRVQLSHTLCLAAEDMHRTLRRLHSQQLCVPLRTFLRFVFGTRSDMVGLKVFGVRRRFHGNSCKPEDSVNCDWPVRPRSRPNLYPVRAKQSASIFFQYGPLIATQNSDTSWICKLRQYRHPLAYLGTNWGVFSGRGHSAQLD
jgi:hypothetical protein